MGVEGLGGQKYWHSFKLRPIFNKAIPNFFITIVVDLPIEQDLLRITKRRILPVSRTYLAELLISGLF